MRHKTYGLFITNIPKGTTELHTRTFDEYHYRQEGEVGREHEGLSQEAAFAVINEWNAQAVRNVELKRTQILFTYFI